MRLKKELNLLEVVSITAGAMMSSGLFILPGLAFERAGPAVIASYLLAALLAGAGMLSQAELASAMPRAGGAYFYVTRTMGPAVGTIYGLITFAALALKSAFELVGMAAFTHLVLDLDIRLIAALLCAVFICLNLLGTKRAGRVQVVLVTIIMAALIIYVAGGLPGARPSAFEPFAPLGAAAVFSTAGFVFMSYGGLLKIASLAEEVKDPGRTLPLGMILSLAMVVCVYVLVVFVTVGVSRGAGMGGSLTPLSDAAHSFMGPAGRALLGAAAVVAFAGAANAGIMGASRYPLALARDGFLPEVLGRIGQRFKTPHFSLLLTGAFMVGALFLKIEVLVKAASSVLILTYVFSCLANVIMRESRIQNYRPSFRAPLYPFVQLAGMAGFALLLFEIGLEALLLCVGLGLAGLWVYWRYGRVRAASDYALLHWIERITAKELTSRTLETELKEIIHERDDIKKDEFDRLAERSMVLDLEGPMSAEQFFELAADALAAPLKTNRNDVLRLLLERESDSSTVISPGLAVPHVIIKGEHAFEMLLARSKEGVTFDRSERPVHALFVLCGTMDERNLHLRALAAIAQIAMDPEFEKIWLEAKGQEALRDVVLLGKRRR